MSSAGNGVTNDSYPVAPAEIYNKHILYNESENPYQAEKLRSHSR